MAGQAEQMELEVQGATGAEVPAGTTQPVGDTEATRQPEVKPRINLDEFEDFQKWKSKMDTQIRDIRTGYQQELTAAQRRAQEAEQRIHEERMRGMDETQRLAYENQLLRQQWQEEQRRRQLQEYAWQKDQDLREAAAESGLTYEELAEALPPGADSHVMWKTASALKKAKEKRTAPSVQSPSTQENNRVDVGGAKPNSESARLQSRYEAASKSFNLDEALSIIQEAKRAGIDLKV